MPAALAATALLMGLAGGGHCLAMCGPLCGALSAGAARGEGAVAVVRLPRDPDTAYWHRTVALQGGRLVGYAAAGAVAATAMQGFAWLTGQTGALRPLWTLAHLVALAWGLLLLLQARQPAWVERIGRAFWRRAEPLLRTPGRVWTAGLLWTFMPCGLLYSALLVAALSGGPADGALAMLLFGLGSAVWLFGGAWLWRRIRAPGAPWAGRHGTRLAGLVLSCVAAWSLWMGVQRQIALWC